MDWEQMLGVVNLEMFEIGCRLSESRREHTFVCADAYPVDRQCPPAGGMLKYVCPGTIAEILPFMGTYQPRAGVNYYRHVLCTPS